MRHEKICIIGGSGFVGSHLAALLAAQGHLVRVPTRRTDRAKALTVLPTVELVEADVHDPEALQESLRGMDAAINLVGILHGSPGAFERTHVELPRKIVQACRAEGVGRLLHMSALGADTASRSRYQQSRAQGEAVAMAEGLAAGIAVTAFRPSVIFGPGDSFLSLFAGLLKLAPIVPLADAATRFQPVYVGDVARAYALSLDDPATHGQVFSLCGPSVYSLEQLVRLAGEAAGTPRPILPLNREQSLLFARLMELKPGRKIMTRDNHYSMLTDNVCPEGCPQRFGSPTPLEAVIGYLAGDGPRSRYTRFRSLAQR